jgi:hypothetical protein
MNDFVHSDGADAMRRALALLDEAVGRHEAELARAGDDDSAAPAQALRRSIGMMRREADLLRLRLRDA